MSPSSRTSDPWRLVTPGLIAASVTTAMVLLASFLALAQVEGTPTSSAHGWPSLVLGLAMSALVTVAWARHRRLAGATHDPALPRLGLAYLGLMLGWLNVDSLVGLLGRQVSWGSVAGAALAIVGLVAAVALIASALRRD